MCEQIVVNLYIEHASITQSADSVNQIGVFYPISNHGSLNLADPQSNIYGSRITELL